jgi:hypothetical protein
MVGYAEPLRAIGQALETLNIQRFEMEPVGEDFLIRGDIAVTNRILIDDHLTYNDLRRNIWGNLPEKNPESGDTANRSEPTVDSPVELLYRVTDVERLEADGRSRRINPHGTTNPTSLSQILRCIGAYLNQKRARLLKLSRQAESVCVEYETSLGTNIKELLSRSDLYDLWVRMYLQRTKRASP